MIIQKTKFWHKISRGFTLVELIVTITIIAILSTIAYLNLGNMAGSARDSSRISNIGNIKKWLDVFRIRTWTYPKPENSTTLNVSGAPIAYQWFAKEQIESLSRVSRWAVIDPADSSMYTTYSTTSDGLKMQLMTFLEDKSTISALSNFSVYANPTTDYSTRHPYTIGENIWILLTSTGNLAPIQEWIMTGTIDLQTTNSGYTVYFNNATKTTGTGGVLKTAFTEKSIVYATTEAGGACNIWENNVGGVCKDPYWNNVVLNMHMSGSSGSTSFIDNSSTPKTISGNGSSQISTAMSKFSSGSTFFPDASSFLTSTNGPAWGWLWNSDYTIDFWLYVPTLPGDITWLMSLGDSDNWNTLLLMLQPDGTFITYWSHGNSNVIVSNQSIPLNTWNLISVARQWITTTSYLNGVKVGQVINATDDLSSQILQVNRWYGGGTSWYNWWWYIDDLRITKWVARYNWNFSVPTNTFPNN